MTQIALPRATPESQGVPSPAIAAFIEAFQAARHDIHSLMILRQGQVIAERWWHPYTPDRKHQLYSLSKSFTSTAAGFAVQEGRLQLNDKVVDLFPDKLPIRVSENLRAMRVRDLLTMSTGHETVPDVWEHEDWAEAFFAHPVTKEPGTHFVYNTPATYMIAAILDRLTGEDLVDYLKPRLLDPLGIDGSTWERCPLGIRTGGFGLSLTTEEIAKFGQFYLQKGVWEGKRLLPEAWIQEATSKQVSNGDDPNSDWAQGYGFQFWRCKGGAYRGDGAFGQYCVVSEEHDLVVAITSGASDMQAVLDLVWDFFSFSGKGEIPQHLELRGPVPTHMPRKIEKAYDILRIEGDLDTVRLSLGEHEITAAYSQWGPEGKTAYQSAMPTRYGPGEPTPYRAQAAWTGPDELTIRIAYIETPFHPWLVLKFGEGICTFQSKGPISLFDAGDRPEQVATETRYP